MALSLCFDPRAGWSYSNSMAQAKKTSPRKKNRPSAADSKASPSRRKKRTSKSVWADRNKLFGMVVFALGLLGFVAVIWMAADNFLPAMTGSTKTDAEQRAERSSDSGSARVNLDPLQGVWETQFDGTGDYAALMIDEDRFRLLYSPASGEENAISAGIVEPGPENGVLTLNAISPVTREMAERDKLSILTLRDYNLRIESGPDGQITIRPFIMAGRNDQLHPLFFKARSGEAPTRWTKQ